MIKDSFPEKAELIVFSKNIFTKKNMRNIFTLEFTAFFCGLMRLWFLKLFTMKKELFSKTSIRDESKTALYFTALYLEFMYLRAHDNGEKLYIVDHGLIQCLSSLVWDKENISRRSDKLITYVAEHFAQNVDYVYTAGCGAEETYRRVEERGRHTRLNYYSREEGLDILRNLENLFEKTNEILGRNGRVVEIDNSLDIQTGFEKLCEHFNLQVSQ